jgi:hypothetical protein
MQMAKQVHMLDMMIFLVPRIRQNAEEFNNHFVLKPVELMQHLID